MFEKFWVNSPEFNEKKIMDKINFKKFVWFTGK